MNRAVLARKVSDLLMRVARVRELLPPTEDAFGRDRTAAEALILNLYLALQGCSDLALAVVADRGLGVPANVRDAHTLLARAGVVPVELSRRLAGAVGLRNRIAHEYGDLNLSRVYQAARDDLGDLEDFAKAVVMACQLG
jgi:uncharacterized protein YutE (UPF0331/DUF86 family)